MMTANAPTRDRIEALDFVRGCALFGILLMNITGMGLAEAYTNPQNAGGATGANLWAWIVTEVGFEGTQRAIFSMLFGAGVLLFTQNAERTNPAGAVDLFLRRTLLLVGFGLINAWILLWSGDILYYYGITGLFVVAFRKLPAKTLLAIGLAGLLFEVALGGYDASQTIAARDAAAVSRPTTEATEKWQEISGHIVADPKDVAKATKAMQSGYASAWWVVASDVAHYQSWALYRYFFDIFAMMLIGMALLKSGVLTLAARPGVYWAMLLGGYAVGLTTNILETRWIVVNGFSADAFAESAITYNIGRLATATGHLGLLLLFCRSGALSWLRTRMAAVGRMALTNYLIHSLIALTLFVLLRRFGTFERAQLYLIVFAIWLAQFLWSKPWLERFQFGPVEWVWRALTYGERPVWRKVHA